MIRVLQHDTDADARVVAILMHKLGIAEIEITNDDEMAAAAALYTRRVLIGSCPNGSARLMVVAADDVPGEDEVFQ